ncbi:MAG: hypothetical protein QXF82_07940 [Nitrososphaeria archaeon]
MISYEEMKASIYDPLLSINQSIMLNETKEGFRKPKKAEESGFNHDLRCLSVLRNLSKLFGSLLPIQDVINTLKKEGFDNPEAIIRKLMGEGKIYEPKNGFLKVLGSADG